MQPSASLIGLFTFLLFLVSSTVNGDDSFCFHGDLKAGEQPSTDNNANRVACRFRDAAGRTIYGCFAWQTLTPDGRRDLAAPVSYGCATTVPSVGIEHSLPDWCEAGKEESDGDHCHLHDLDAFTRRFVCCCTSDMCNMDFYREFTSATAAIETIGKKDEEGTTNVEGDKVVKDERDTPLALALIA